MRFAIENGKVATGANDDFFIGTFDFRGQLLEYLESCDSQA